MIVKVGICVADYLGNVNLGNHFGHSLADDSLSDIFIRERCCNECVKVVFDDGFSFLVELWQAFDLDNVVILARLLRLFGRVFIIDLGLEVPFTGRAGRRP